jgi:hypothetical protein
MSIRRKMCGDHEGYSPQNFLAENAEGAENAPHGSYGSVRIREVKREIKPNRGRMCYYFL